MESEENNLDDGYSWKKYGQRLIMGNQNTRLYNICVNKRLAYSEISLTLWAKPRYSMLSLNMYIFILEMVFTGVTTNAHLLGAM